MFVQEINIPDKAIKLISPEYNHSKISFGWVSGDKGRKLLEKMGNNLSNDWNPSLEEEERRLDDFITKEDEINWAIQYKGKIVGAVWLNLRDRHLIGPT